jgi:hypothetical protein
MGIWLRQVTAIGLVLAVASACDSSPVDADNGDPVAEGSLISVYLTDAPGDVEAVWVDVHEIYLQGGPGGRTVLLDEPTGLIELTSLVGTARPLVEDEEIEAGTYGQLRFVIGGAVLETQNGQVYSKDGTEHPDGLPATGNLICPSCSQTGIKVVLRGEDLNVEEGENDFLLDFDVSQTFGRQAGQSGNWVMHPVIHGIRMIEMGSISGTVVLAEDGEGTAIVEVPECPAGTARGVSDFVPTATAATPGDEGETIVRTGTTGADGSFQIHALAPDQYDLGYASEIELEGAGLLWTATVDPNSVTVGEGESVSGVTYTITAASCIVEEEDENGGEDED